MLKYGGTQYTISYDLDSLTVYFQTSDNPRVRSVSLNGFAFDDLDAPQSIQMRDASLDYATDVTPAAN